MQEINAEATRAALPFAQLIPALEAAFATGCEVPPRHHHTIAAAGGDATMLLMPAWIPDRFLGIKIANVFPGNSARGIPALSSLYVLCDGTTGRHLALIDGNEITARRTAAVSALAASFLSRAESSRMLVVGAGRVASLLPDAYRVVRPIERVDVWNITRANSEAFAARLRGAGFDAHAVDDLEAAAAAADIVSCATLSTAPLVRGAWLRPGTHVDLIGSFARHMREADDETVGRASVFVDTMAAIADAGDLVHPIENGTLRREDVKATLADLCRRQHRGRSAAGEITLFKSVGTALADLAAAMLAYGAAAATTPISQEPVGFGRSTGA
jgi:ornithine cyclodeaminase